MHGSVRKAAIRIALAILLSGGCGVLLDAQTQAPATRPGPIYNPATEVTIKGTIEAVNHVAGARAWTGTHLTLKTDSGSLDVHVGPSWFLEQNKLSFAKGDEISVTGSKVKYGETDALLAREITKTDQKVTLRTAKGFPLWSRHGRHP